MSLLFVHLLASADNDMDGVENGIDQCPNTPFFELVDKRGCSTQKLTLKEEPYHADIMLGGGYVKIDEDHSDTLSSVMADLYYKDFIFTLFTQSYSQNNAYAGNDLYFFANYKMKLDALTLKFGPGIVLPVASENSNKTDYFLNVNVNYKIDKFDFNLYYKYTFMNDDFTRDVDTKSIGVGYYMLDTTYLNISYTDEKSVYSDIEDIENLTFMVNHVINEHWFANVRVSHGISDSASILSTIFNLGYYY